MSVPACDTDASGGKVPSLAAVESSTPAQRVAWMTSLCAASQAKDTLQQLPAGIVLPAIALRCLFLCINEKSAYVLFLRAGRYMVATSDSPVPSWFIAGLSMAMLRPFNEEKVKRTEEVKIRDSL